MTDPASKSETQPSRLMLRVQGWFSAVLVIVIAGLLAWLSTRYVYTADWTSSGRHTLSMASADLLHKLKKPIDITAYAREEPELRSRITDLVDRYQRVKSDIKLRFVNPDAVPDQLRKLGVTVDGEMIIHYAGRSEHLKTPSERGLTNALERLARGGERWIVFLTGHGEQNPHGNANFDLGEWGKQLQNRGLKVETVNLGKTAAIPDNTAVLVIADPQVDLLPGEVHIIESYVKRGGNLLWLTEPGPLHGLKPLAEQLGIRFVPGTVVDPTTQLFGVKQADIVMAASYPPQNPITGGFKYLTVFPQASGMTDSPPKGWKAEPLITTAKDAWSETGKLAGAVKFDPGQDTPGPLHIAYDLTRPLPQKGAKAGRGNNKDSAANSPTRPTQRVVVVGDSNFLSNAYLGNSGNLDLGLKIMNWLAHDDNLIDVPAHTAPDLTLQLSRAEQILIGFGFLLGLPLIFLASGISVWLRRRHS